MEKKRIQVAFRVTEAEFKRLQTLHDNWPLISMAAFVRECFIRGIDGVEKEYTKPKGEPVTKPQAHRAAA